MNTNTGSLQNTYNYLVPAAGTTRGYRVTKEFIPGQIEVCDFRNMALDGVSFVPSGVLIDNTRGVGDCIVTILEYSWRIVIPAGQFAHMPYPAPYNQTATIEGNAPELTVVFVDYPVIPFFQNSNSGGGSVGGITDIIAGDGISIDKTDPSAPVISATGGGGGGGGSGEKLVTLVGMLSMGEDSEGVSPMIQIAYDPDGLWDSSVVTIPAGSEYVKMDIELMAYDTTPISMNIYNQAGSAAFGRMVTTSSGANVSLSTTYFGALLPQLGGAIFPLFDTMAGGAGAGAQFLVTINVRIK